MAPNQYKKIPDFAEMSDDKKSFTIDWHGETIKYIKDAESGKWIKSTNEDASAGATDAGNIATNTAAGFGKKTGNMFFNTKQYYFVDPVTGKKKKKKLAESATAGSTNTTDFGNDFGTNTPRLPSEQGSLDGKKSMGMGSGFTEYNLKIKDPFTGKTYKLLRVLNKQGHVHDGGSTTKHPVKRSPYDEYVKGAEFKFKDSERGKARKHEINTRKEHKKLRDILQQAFVDSIHPEKIPDVKKVTKDVDNATKKLSKDLEIPDKDGKE